MPATDFEALKAAVKATLDTIPRIGKVETRRGGIPTWVEKPGPYRAFWEVGVLSVAETHYATGDCVWEDPTLEIEGAMPYSYEENTERAWLELVRAATNALRANPSLKVGGVPTVTNGWAGFGLPQLIENNFASYSDRKEIPRVHHCIIQVTYRNDFDFEAE